MLLPISRPQLYEKETQFVSLISLLFQNLSFKSLPLRLSHTHESYRFIIDTSRGWRSFGR